MNAAGALQARFPTLGAPISLGSRLLRNRVVLAPMSVAYADSHGYVTQAMVEHYARRAQGGVAMVITENLAVNVAGRQLPKQALISDERFVPGLSELAAEIKRHGAAAIAQLVHAGRYAGPWAEYEARRRLAPSALAFPLLPDRVVTPQEMTAQEIDETIEAFANATRLARLAGFDGVEIHGAQGFLISSFTSPRTNQRADAYGGSFDNRCRFAEEVVDAAIRSAGPDMIVGYHLMSDELMPGGWTLEDAIELAKRLAVRGVDFVMPVVSTFESLREPANTGLLDRPMFQHHSAARLAPELDIPVITNGRMGNPADCERVLARSEAALVGLGRPLLADPDWLLKVQEGRGDELRTCQCSPATCLQTQLTGVVCSSWPQPIRDTGYLGYNA